MLTADIKAEWGNWLNIVRRLQAEGSKQEGLAIAQFFVVLDSDGKPFFWTNPKVTLIEPKNQIGKEHLKTLYDIFGERLLELISESVR